MFSQIIIKHLIILITALFVSVGYASDSDSVLVIFESSGGEGTSSEYIQNQTDSIQTANFSISGNANIGGKIGIGTTDPAVLLEVQGNTNVPMIRVSNDLDNYMTTRWMGSYGVFFTREEGTLHSNTLVLRSGNVGINITNPDSRLQVNGIIHSMEGGIKFPDNTIQTTAYNGIITKVKAESRDMSLPTQDVSYTGYGFMPTTLLIFAGGPPGTSNLSWGMVDSEKYMARLRQNPAGQVGYNVNDIIYLETTTGNIQKAQLISYDPDGFTLRWTKSGSPTGTLVFYVWAAK